MMYGEIGRALKKTIARQKDVLGDQNDNFA